MPLLNRRAVLCAAMLPLGGGAISEPASAETADIAAETLDDATKTLARYIVEARYDDLPENVRKEGVRTLLNWVGVAIGGSRHQTVDIAASALAPFSGPPRRRCSAARERFDIMNAAFVNGVSSHIFDYDDTHLKTIIHPAGPVASAILALRRCSRSRAAIFSTRWCSASRPSAASATRSIPITTTSAGTSPAPPAYSAPPRPSASCWASTSSR